MEPEVLQAFFTPQHFACGYSRNRGTQPRPPSNEAAKFTAPQIGGLGAAGGLNAAPDTTLWTGPRNGVPRAVRRHSEALRPLAPSRIAGNMSALAASKLPSRLHDPTPQTFVETALLTLSRYVV